MNSRTTRQKDCEIRFLSLVIYMRFKYELKRRTLYVIVSLANALNAFVSWVMTGRHRRTVVRRYQSRVASRMRWITANLKFRKSTTFQPCTVNANGDVFKSASFSGRTTLSAQRILSFYRDYISFIIRLVDGIWASRRRRVLRMDRFSPTKIFHQFDNCTLLNFRNNELFISSYSLLISAKKSSLNTFLN